jgi:hypothetical protein
MDDPMDRMLTRLLVGEWTAVLRCGLETRSPPLDHHESAVAVQYKVKIANSH